MAEAWLITGNQRHFTRKPFIVAPAERMAIIRSNSGSGNQTDFIIRHTRMQDLPAVMEIYAKARRFMAEHGNPNQWGPTNWPPEDLVRRDIQERKSYVCESGGHIAAVFFYDYGKDVEPSYSDITDGQWQDSGSYGVVHRIASDGTVKGAGSFCIQWALEQCGHLRLDTHGDNRVMQNLLEKLGFHHCGTVYVKVDNYPRMAYEKTNNQEWRTNMGRLKTLRNYVDGELNAMENPEKRTSAIVHLYGVSLAAAMLAKKRGLDPELLSMAAMLHDLYAYKSGSYEDHAHKGAELAREILDRLALTTPEETDTICSAIYHHDDKYVVDSPMDEALKDADVIHHCMNDLSKAVKDKEKARYESLCREFGMV